MAYERVLFIQMSQVVCLLEIVQLWGSVAQWLARRTCDPAVAGSIPATTHFVIALAKQFTYISSVHPSAKWVAGHRQSKCIDY